jgi:hypothetical protein
MGTIAGIIATAALSHLGGASLGGVLAKFGVLGFGKKLSIARHVLKVGKALRDRLDRDRNEEAREDLKAWLKKHDPDNESGFGNGIS